MRLEIIEVGPRDGLQSEPEVLPTADKRALIEKAIDAGVRRIEVASFVNPKRVPQMADAEKLLEMLPRHDCVSFIGLVLNDRGFDRAQTTGVHEISMPVVATDTYNRNNQGVSTAESVASWLRVSERAKAAGIKTSVTLSAAFGCPFEGEVSTDRVVSLVTELMAGAPDELALADSIGVAAPHEVTELISAVRDVTGDLPLRCHFHNTRNTGIANAYAAATAGVTALDASIGGIGGCPFAPAATGNIPTEDLAYMLERSGIDTGLDLPKLLTTSDWLKQLLGHEVPAMLPKAGLFPPNRTAA